MNDILPSVAQEYGIDPHEFEGRGLDAHSYVGDEGGGLWGGLCKAKGNGVKNKTVSDFFHLKQSINLALTAIRCALPLTEIKRSSKN